MTSAAIDWLTPAARMPWPVEAPFRMRPNLEKLDAQTPALLLRDELADDGIQFLGVFDAIGIGLVARVADQVGAADADVKRYETEAAVDLGAQEIDVVMNLGRFKDGFHGYVVRELRDIVEAADDRPVKVILETCLLTDEEIVKACQLALEAEVHFVKTSTGFNKGGATVEHVKLMRATVGRNCGVKASGGIRDAKTALAMIEAGATRLGTSASVAIVQGLATDFSTSY